MNHKNFKIFIFILFFVFLGNHFIKAKAPNIYLKKQESPKIEQIEASIKILALGDLMLGRYIETLIFRNENMFVNLPKEMFENKDYILVNLENPITLSEKSIEKSINLKMHPKNIKILKEKNINLISLANNHLEDFLQQGISDTIKYLEEAKIKYFGIYQEPLILEKDDLKIAFFGINALWGNIDPYYNLIQETATKVDYVIVSIHWGEEYFSQPSKTQIKIGQKLIDSGASIVLGHHPHTTQPIEKYKNGIIFYSLGNFVFDQIDPITFKELGVNINIDKEEIKFELLPMTVNHFKPELLSSNEKLLECKNLAPEIELDNCMFSIEFKH
ncbi:CapA family protein [Patescibacteria group bacterium]|nr:CapA family protein [Patescibacteria group bacterium]